MRIHARGARHNVTTDKRVVRHVGCSVISSPIKRTEKVTAIIIVRWIMLDPHTAPIASLQPLLDASEQAQAGRFHLAADRDAHIAAHALLRTMLCRATGIAPGEWRFQTGENGKPVLLPTQAPPDLHFSLSHTRGLVACAVGHPYPLGVDVEAWTMPAPMEIAHRYFASTEAHLIAQQADAERSSTFYRIWTLKEAYLKATGQGLSTPLDSFAFSLDPIAITLSAPNISSAWQFAEFRPGPAHSLALAVHSPSPIPIDAAAMSLDRIDHPDPEPLARRISLK